MNITKKDLKAVATKENYVHLKRFDCDIRKLLVRYSDGCPDHVIASALIIREEEVPTKYEEIIQKLRLLMGVKDV